ncbi:MAG: DUF5723 family protein [Bacteroidales bacterium]|jgi:hypothetical protein|nr:DUF5723 family protein [Bacteroidales bacterium]
MSSIRRVFICFCISFIAIGFVFSQQSHTLFFQHLNPQSNVVNPAIMSPCPVFFSLPLLGSIHLNANSTGFNYADLSKDKTLDLGSLVSQLHAVDFVTAEFHYTPFSFGIYLPNDDYLNITWSEKVDVKAFYPKKLIDFAARGNTQHLGNPLKIKSPGLNAVYYRELSVGIAREVSRDLDIGIHAKILFGQAGVFTRRGKMVIDSNSTTYDFTADWDFGIDASFPLDITRDVDGYVSDLDVGDVKFPSAVLTFKNPGIAFDFGFVYHTGDLVFSGSILDLGLMYWSKDTRKFRQNGQFTFSGANITDGLNSSDFFSEMKDSLKNQLKVTDTNSGFLTFTTPKIYVGVVKPVNDLISLGINARTDIYPGRPVAGLSFQAIASPGRYTQFSLSYSLMNYSFVNVGAGITVGGDRFQFYAVSDNILAFFTPEKARNGNIRFGFNFFLGCSEGKSNQNGRSGSGVCNWILKEENREKRYKKL